MTSRTNKHIRGTTLVIPYYNIRNRFTLQQALSFNAGIREDLLLLGVQLSGSEGIGLMAPFYQLAPTADSL